MSEGGTRRLPYKKKLIFLFERSIRSRSFDVIQLK